MGIQPNTVGVACQYQRRLPRLRAALSHCRMDRSENALTMTRRRSPMEPQSGSATTIFPNEPIGLWTTRRSRADRQLDGDGRYHVAPEAMRLEPLDLVQGPEQAPLQGCFVALKDIEVTCLGQESLLA